MSTSCLLQGGVGLAAASTAGVSSAGLAAALTAAVSSGGLAAVSSSTSLTLSSEYIAIRLAACCIKRLSSSPSFIVASRVMERNSKISLSQKTTIAIMV